MNYQDMIIEVECAFDTVGISATPEQIEKIAKLIKDGIENHGMGAPDYPRTILESEHSKIINGKEEDIKCIRESYEDRIKNLKSYISDLESAVSDLRRRN